MLLWLILWLLPPSVFWKATLSFLLPLFFRHNVSFSVFGIGVTAVVVATLIGSGFLFGSCWRTLWNFCRIHRVSFILGIISLDSPSSVSFSFPFPFFSLSANLTLTIMIMIVVAFIVIAPVNLVIIIVVITVLIAVIGSVSSAAVSAFSETECDFASISFLYSWVIPPPFFLSLIYPSRSQYCL